MRRRTSNLPNRDCLNVAGDKIGLACLADDMAEPYLVIGKVFEAGEVFNSVTINRCGHLDFNWMEDMSILDNKVDFSFLRVAIEPNVM